MERNSARQRNYREKDRFDHLPLESIGDREEFYLILISDLFKLKYQIKLAIHLLF